MNNERYEKISLNRIGYTCVEEAVSCVFDYRDELYRSLNYSIHQFIYNRKTFTNYNFTEDPESYLFKNNMLLFEDISKPSLEYKIDFKAHIDSLTKDYLDDVIIPIKVDDIMILKGKYLDNNICVCLLVDIYYLTEDYIKYNNTFQRRSRHLTHYINLFDINYGAGTCKIIDISLSVKGDVSFERLCLAFSKVNEATFYVKKLARVENDLQTLLLKNLKNSCKGSAYINGNHYHVNTNALINLHADIDDIIDEVYSFAGKFSSQYISLPLISVRNMSRSTYYLYEHLAKYEGCLRPLAVLFKRYSELWDVFDGKLDKIFLKEENILNKKADFKSILLNLVSLSQQIDDEIGSLISSKLH